MSMPQVEGPIPELADEVLLRELSGELKFMSANHQLPDDWCTGEFKFTFDGHEITGASIREIYAPGDETGWAVVYNLASEHGRSHDGSVSIIRGNWHVERLGHSDA